MSDTSNIAQEEDPSIRLGFLRARQHELLTEIGECAHEIDRCMVELVAAGRSQADVARDAGVQRAEVSRRIKRLRERPNQ